NARLSGVGVAHQSHTQHRVATRTDVLPVLLDILELGFEALNLAANDSPVGLQLGLARTAKSDTAADSREVGPHSGQPGKQILQLGQRDLKRGLVASSTDRKDVENDLGPV